VNLPAAVAAKLRVIRQTEHEGYIVARNTIMRTASTDYVLLMDDDAALLSGDTILDALGVLDAHPRIGAIACAMAERDGSPWQPAMQPAPVDYPCHVPAFIGFAHILRRALFTELGGYRESLHSYGEEKDYCLRMLDAGFDSVYLPNARVVHAPDPAGRSQSKYVRYTIRNDCLFALYNEPLPLPLLSVPLRLLRYLRMARNDRGGFGWIMSALVRRLPSIWRERRPVKWSTLRRWRSLRKTWPVWVPGVGSPRLPGVAIPRNDRTITVGITTRNRHARLAECLTSLSLLGDLVSRIIVVDDASDLSVRDALDALPADIAAKMTVIRQPAASGNIICRNVAVRHATTDELLLLDDDTILLDAETVRRGLELMERDATVAAVGFAMAAPDGSLLPRLMQPAPASYVCYVPSYIGFAHLIRRAAFDQVGGYRELFERHGEEKECCLRLMDAGYHIVFVPDPPIVHHVDPTGRNLERYLKTVIRNDCLGALYNEPLPMLLVSIPIRLARYLSMRRQAGVDDPGGLRWIVAELGKNFVAVVRARHPVKWSTIRRWRRIRRTWPAYGSGAA
jgi:GT2 family glycosyltransferase